MARILCVDDDFKVMAFIDQTLTGEGHSVSTCDNVLEADQLCHSYEFDLIILDLYLIEEGRVSKFGGFSFLHRLRQSPQSAHMGWWQSVPVLVISGGLSASYGLKPNPKRPLTNALDVGANATLAKPFDAPALINAANGLL